MRHLCKGLLALLVLLGAGAAHGQQQWGPKIGVFIPTSSDLRDATGEVWFNIGFSSLKPDNYRRFKIGWDFNILAHSTGDDHVLILTPSVGVVSPLGRPGAENVPYVSARVGASYVDFDIEGSSLTESGSGIAFNANAEVGVSIGENLNIALRYDLLSEIEGISFDGLTLSLKWGIVRF